jgi:hypothetical protein
MSESSSFNLREWLVPPVLVPIFLALLVAAAMLFNASCLVRLRQFSLSN